MCVTCEKTLSHSVELNIHTRTYHKETKTSDQAKPITSRTEKTSCQIPQNLKYKCTECKHQEEKEEDLIQHIETKHAAILSPAKISKQFKCTECSHKENERDNIIKHIEMRHKTIFTRGKVTRPVPAPCSKQTKAAIPKPNHVIDVEEDANLLPPNN